ANGSSPCPTKNDPAALATGSSNLALLVTPSDTSNGTLTERHYRMSGLFSCRDSRAPERKMP
ncbi:hypothetical protein, partial [Ralstonia pseudosolanacearum]|uniref:hypothetical protein n=1 Tax=Ralstonia pseudosolanacearum TaxID=1310165 RepID=UPI002002B20E